MITPSFYLYVRSSHNIQKMEKLISRSSLKIFSSWSFLHKKSTVRDDTGLVSIATIFPFQPSVGRLIQRILYQPLINKNYGPWFEIEVKVLLSSQSRRTVFLPKVTFEGHEFLHLHNRKTKAFNHFECFPADSTALYPPQTGIIGNNFFSLRRIVTCRQRASEFPIDFH